MKTILITGASSGIGRATAIRFQAEGWNVAATMRNPEKETELQKLSNVAIFSLDVTNRESIEAAAAGVLDKFGGLNVLLNNAGYGLAGPWRKTAGCLGRAILQIKRGQSIVGRVRRAGESIVAGASNRSARRTRRLGFFLVVRDGGLRRAFGISRISNASA
jgi:hypothetical protein